MNQSPILDRIHIRDLGVRCIIGFKDWERTKKQDVLVNLTLHADLTTACGSDSIGDTIDYKTLKNSIVQMAEDSQFQLIERLAQAVATLCLSDPRVVRVDVSVDKPGALRFAKSVAVEISRIRLDP